MHVAAVDAGKAVVTGIVVFLGIVVRSGNDSGIIVFSD
jgi:hypothetical protein